MVISGSIILSNFIFFNALTKSSSGSSFLHSKTSNLIKCFSLPLINFSFILIFSFLIKEKQLKSGDPLLSKTGSNHQSFCYSFSKDKRNIAAIQASLVILYFLFRSKSSPIDKYTSANNLIAVRGLINISFSIFH